MTSPSYKRLLKAPKRSFFLFGPRGCGKSTWLRQNFPKAKYIDLLRSELFLELSRHPERLEALIGNAKPDEWICIDEIQKIPALLDEVHRLIESKQWCFALTGSSARKLKRGAANLLGGRALTLDIEGFSFAELNADFDIDLAVHWGTLPLVKKYPDEAPQTLLSYVHTYLKEEIREEGLVRKVDSFSRFLEVAGQLNGQILNIENIAREAHVPRSTVHTFFEIAQETLIGHFLPSYRPGSRVREAAHSKFYFFDSGVARAAAGRTTETVDALWLGTALETYIFHELRVYNSVSQKHKGIYFYRTGNGVEIDFIIEKSKKSLSKKAEVVCIEIKSAKKWDRRWESAAKSLEESDTVRVARKIGVYLGSNTYRYDRFDVLPVHEFLKELWAGEIY